MSVGFWQTLREPAGGGFPPLTMEDAVNITRTTQASITIEPVENGFLVFVFENISNIWSSGRAFDRNPSVAPVRQYVFESIDRLVEFLSTAYDPSRADLTLEQRGDLAAMERHVVDSRIETKTNTYKFTDGGLKIALDNALKTRTPDPTNWQLVSGYICKSCLINGNVMEHRFARNEHLEPLYKCVRCGHAWYSADNIPF